VTQDPHRSSWDSPEGEQPVEPSAGPSQPRVSEQPTVHDTGGWAQPSWPAQQPAPPPAPAPPVPDGPHGGGRPAHGQAPGYGPPPGYGQAPPGYGYGYAGVPASAAPKGPVPTGAIVLVVLSGLLALVLSWTVVGLLYVAPAILAVVAMTRAGGDPAGARRLTRTGWIVFGAMTALLGVLVVVGLVLLFSLDGGSSATSGGVSV
jgi:hypothetical protein